MTIYKKGELQRKRVSTEVVGDSLTEQHHRDDCNINNVVARHKRVGINPLRSGLLFHVNKKSGKAGDFSQNFDFADVQNKILEAKEAFEQLPAKLRKRFDNDPAQLFDFLHDDTNREEALALGLLEPVAKPNTTDANPSPSGNEDNTKKNRGGKAAESTEA